MLTLRDQITAQAAVERSSRQSGELATYVTAKIQGNYRNGPVPVTVKYWFHFQYNDRWTDSQGINSVAQDFDSAEDRDAYVQSHFSIG